MYVELSLLLLSLAVFLMAAFTAPLLANLHFYDSFRKENLE